MDEATIDKLEFSRVRDALGARCATSLGKRRARSMRPAVKAKLVKDWLTQVRELTDLVAADSAPPMGGVHDIREAVRATALPAPLEPEALGRIADTLVASGNLHAWFDRIADRVPSLASLKEQIHDLSEVAAVINEKIDGRGGVRDHASERLAAVRRGIEEARGRARDVVDSLLRQDRFSRFLQYAGSTFHNDRLVLPLKAEHRGRIPGIIHRSSDSGATLFVEPAESVALNNTLVGLRERESKEITRILTELSRHVQ
ncbi:MAG: hypothetical protein ACE5EX_10005, partial [Phycisphaerae bacterium]